MVEGEEDKDKIIKDEQVKKPRTIIKWIISIISLTVIVFVAILGYKIYYNRTHWITVTFYDRYEYGVIKEPIIIEIHPGEKVEFPKLEEEINNAPGYLGWETYYYGDDGRMHLRTVYEDEVFVESIEIFPVYSINYTPFNDYENMPYYFKNK